MATKAELEQNYNTYRQLLTNARAAMKEGNVVYAISFIMIAADHINGMMQYANKYCNEAFASLEAIDLLEKLAPLAFDLQSIEKMEQVVRSQRRIQRNTGSDLLEQLEQIRSQVWDAHRMWNLLEGLPWVRQDSLRQTLGGDQAAWRELAEAWERIGAIQRIADGGSYQLRIRTRMDDIASGKCPSCGVLCKGQKTRFLEPQTCPKCKTQGVFVLISTELNQAGS